LKTRSPGLKSGAGTDEAMVCYKNGSSFSLLPRLGPAAPAMALKYVETPMYGLKAVPFREVSFSAACEAVKRQAIYGTAEAVPFVKSPFPIWRKPSPSLKPRPSFDNLPHPLKGL
jgi:hypothetical protein